MEACRKLVSTGPQPSCRTDFSAHTFKLHTPDHEDELFAYAWNLAEAVLPTGNPLEPSKGKYFDVKYWHASGLTLEMTSLDSPKTTAGCALLTLPGAIYGALDAPARRDLIIDLYKWPGYYRTTRWDAQITSIEPLITIDEVIEHVAKGRLWVARFVSEQAYERRDKNGLLIEPPTQYFGSPQSNTRLRIYDHGAKHDWQIPSLRVEAQLRKEVADQHFRRLADRCYNERHADPLFVTQEERTVKDTLSQHADLRDTTAWEGRPKPRNWAQNAPRPAWYDQMLQHKADPLQLAHRAELDWDRTMDAFQEQYGRKFFLWVVKEALNRGMETTDVLATVMINCAAKLKKGDDALLAAQVPPGTKQTARRICREATNEIARRQESQEYEK